MEHSDADAPSRVASDNPSSRKESGRPKSLLDVPAAQRAPMSPDEANTFIRLSLADKDREVRETPIARALAELPSDPPAQIRIMVDRMSAGADVPARVPVILFVATLCSTPVRCVLWGYTLAVLTQRLGHAVTMLDFAVAFPNGFPTDDGIRAIWDAQKDREGNRLDRREAWQVQP